MSNGSQEELGLLAQAPAQAIGRNSEKVDADEQRSPPKLDETSDDRRHSHALGTLRIASDLYKPTTLLVGDITCPHCSTSLEIEVERNPNAVLAKQPAFVINRARAVSGNKPIGYLFIGTILSSPVLYYGSINHCGADQRVSVFFNRSLRDRADHHLTIMRSTSGSPETSSASSH